MNLLNDLRFSLRQFRRTPGFTVVAVLTLALGIGATTAIFSLVDQVLLRNLPVREPKQLVMLRFEGSDTGRSESHGGSDREYFSYPMYRDLRERASVFNGMIAMFPYQVGLQWHDTPALANCELVSGNYFDVLGVRPAMGRLFVPSDEGAKGASPLVVLSFAYWRNRFGSDPGIVNNTVSINGLPYTVIGVAAPAFRSAIAGTAPDVFVPMNMKPQITPGWDDLDERRTKWLNIAARLKPGVTVQQAEAALDPVWKSIRADEFKVLPVRNQTADFRIRFVDKSTVHLMDGARGFSGFRDNIQVPLLILMGMVTLLALMASANVASLMLVRAAGRIREMSVRYALGATRSRVTRQLVCEGIVLGVVGGLCGIVLAKFISGTLLRVMFTGSSSIPFSSDPDGRVLVFNVLLSIVLALTFSLAPILQFWNPNVTPALKQQTVTATGGHVRLRKISVGVQIGLSLLLLMGAGLFMRTLRNLQQVDVGFTTDHLLTFQVDPRMAGYATNQVAPLYKRMLETLASQPGMKSVALTDNPDLANNDSTYNVIIPGEEDRGSGLKVEWERVSSGYIATLQQPLLTGRFISDADQGDSAKVAVINESFAKAFFGDANHALGRQFQPGRIFPGYTVVGVVRDAKHRGVRQKLEPGFYTSIFQEKEPSSVEVYMRTYQDPGAAGSTVRAAIHNIDSKLVLDQMQTMDDQIAGILSTERLLAMLASGFGVLAVLMAAIGLYGVLAFSTAQRTREIGIRMALGATRFRVIKMVMREVLVLGGVSILIALPVALGLTRLLRTQLYGISDRDPMTLFAVTFTIVVVSTAAAFIPARRLSSVDPMKALRYE